MEGLAKESGNTRSFEEASDLLAIQETLRGNRNAFAQIVERYTPLLYSLAFRMLGRGEDAQEAVQEILLRAYRALPRFRLERRFHPWLYTIALNYLRTVTRRQRRRRGLRLVRLGEEQDTVADRGELPAAAAEREDGERLAQQALAGLPPAVSGGIPAARGGGPRRAGHGGSSRGAGRHGEGAPAPRPAGAGPAPGGNDRGVKPPAVSGVYMRWRPE